MTDIPKISIILPCFNAAATLAKALESVVTQQYSSLELLVLDAGSTDGTVDIIKEYEPHISYWRSNKDDGPNAAYNEGLEKATGDVVVFLNADDWFEPNTLNQVGQTFAENPEADMVTTVARIIEMAADGKINETKRFEGKSQELNASATPMPNARFCKKSVFQDHGNFLTKNHRGERLIAADLEWLLRLSNQGLNNIILPHMGYTYRVHSDSITFSNNPKNNRRMYDERAWLAELYLESGLSSKEKSRLKRWHKRGTTRLCYFHVHNKDWGAAVEEVKRGLNINPYTWFIEMARLIIVSCVKPLDILPRN